MFEGLSIWKEEKYRHLQGTFPVISMSFAGIKENTFPEARKSICRTLEEQYNKNDYLLKTSLLNEKEKAFYLEVVTTTSDKYGDAFGFTETEVSAALEEYNKGAAEKCDSAIYGMEITFSCSPRSFHRNSLIS